MTVRELKLAIACDLENEEAKALNIFFDELFSGVRKYTKNGEPDLWFAKGDKIIMFQNLKNGVLWCWSECFWRILRYQYGLSYEDVQAIIKYKVEEKFNINMELLLPCEE